MTFAPRKQYILSNADKGLNIAPSRSVSDAFGRLRTADPFSVFSYKHIQTSGNLFFINHTEGDGGIHYEVDKSAIILTVTSASGDRAVRQTKRYNTYEPGRSQLALGTCSLGIGISGRTQRIGYYDDNDGWYFECSDGILNVVIRSSTSGILLERRVPQSQWNIDKLDGTGDSGFKINAQFTNIYVMDAQWLGVGVVRFGISNNNRFVYCHRFNNENLFSSAYVKTASLPFRWEILNTTAVATSGRLEAICCSVFSEGGVEPLGFVSMANTSVLVNARKDNVPAGSGGQHILSVRLKEVANRATLIPISFEVFETTNDYLLAELYLCPRPASDTGLWINASPMVEYNVDGNLPPTGQLLSSFFITPQSRGNSMVVLSELSAGANFDGTIRECLSLVVTPLQNQANVGGAISWKEMN